MDVTQTRRFGYWAATTAILPVAIIGACFSIERYVLDFEGSFGEVFGTGDLLPLAVLLLISVASDIRLEDRRATGVWMALHELWFLIWAIVAILAYGAVKAHGVELLREHSPRSAAVLQQFGAFCWVFTVYVVIHTIAVKWRLTTSTADHSG